MDEGTLGLAHVKAYRSRACLAAIDDELSRRIGQVNAWADVWAKQGAGDDAGAGRQQALDAAAEKAVWALQAAAEVRLALCGGLPHHAKGQSPESLLKDTAWMASLM